MEELRIPLTDKQAAIFDRLTEEIKQLEIAKKIRSDAADLAARVIVAGMTDDSFDSFILSRGESGGFELVATNKPEVK